ncbi:hypothetical protein QFC19_007477 [Naganishia cerealis]|uniref:Uncharacterized protein n=1 Tax=Naganishia cerealis TaxID=610337 RepID=A0ACC2V9C4_9TREE|nr:hypothetical protein QFC19_007477 [Naganishia cerealis]
MSTPGPHSLIPVFQDLAQLRRWRQHLEALKGLLPSEYREAWERRYAAARERAAEGKEGEASAVTANTGATGLSSLEAPLVVFAPTRETMYPLSTIPDDAFVDEPDEAGETVQTPDPTTTTSTSTSTSATAATAMLQDTRKQRGAFVQVKGWGDVLEGESRRTSEREQGFTQFFQGVATVCTKLFNAVEPDHAYFGQKDIQQALLLKRNLPVHAVLQDSLCNHPRAENLHIIPTTRDATTGLALSSRNAYLTEHERLQYAPTLFAALSQAREVLLRGGTAAEAIRLAREEVERVAEQAAREEGGGVVVRLDHVDVFEPGTFRRLRRSLINPSSSQVEAGKTPAEAGRRKAVVVGAMWVGRTRLIDNLLVGWEAGDEL